MKINFSKQIILLLLLAVGFTACSDSGSDATEKEPPSIPELVQKAQPDISLFQNNSPTTPAMSDAVHFNTAKSVVMGGAGFLAIGQVYSAFLNPAMQENAQFVDGEWVWEYSFSQNGQSASIRMTAVPQGDGFKWAVFISFDDGETSVTDVKVMEGTTSNKGAQGDWTFYSLEEQSGSKAFLTSSWTIVTENERTIDLQLYDDAGVVVTVVYEQNGVESTMSFTYPGQSQENIEVFWNSETREGYIVQGTEKSCWDSSLQDVTCS